MEMMMSVPLYSRKISVGVSMLNSMPGTEESELNKWKQKSSDHSKQGNSESDDQAALRKGWVNFLCVSVWILSNTCRDKGHKVL